MIMELEENSLKEEFLLSLLTPFLATTIQPQDNRTTAVSQQEGETAPGPKFIIADKTILQRIPKQSPLGFPREDSQMQLGPNYEDARTTTTSNALNT